MTNDDLFNQVATNVREVRDRIESAARRSGRDGESVQLVAVSKYAQAGDGMIEALVAADCLDLGEARPQLLVEKAEYYADQTELVGQGEFTIRWHLIGSLQRNKARKILPLITLLHSVDSLRLAEALHRIATEENIRSVPCLLEVAISGDDNKHGFEAGELPQVLDEFEKFDHLRVKGLMCMSGLESDAEQTRREFESVRTLAERLRERGLPQNVSMDELSMGMSDDFEIAVEEGATIVRVGSRLYA